MEWWNDEQSHARRAHRKTTATQCDAHNAETLIIRGPANLQHPHQQHHISLLPVSTRIDTEVTSAINISRKSSTDIYDFAHQ